MNKLSRWARRFNSTDNIRTKTHKVSDNVSIYQEDTKLLATEGIGTICFRLKKTNAFNIDLIAKNALLRLSVSDHRVKLYCIYRGRFILLKEDHLGGIGLDNDPACIYWVSFQAHTRTVSYGKTKPSVHNTKFLYTLPKSNKSTNQYWMNKIGRYRVDHSTVIYLSKTAVYHSTE